MSKEDPYHAQHYALPLGFNGRLAMAYRWFSGRPLNGHRYTDSTGFRYGTMSTDLSGKATQYQLLPGYKRFLYARLPLMLTPALTVAALTEPAPTALTLTALTALTVPKVVSARRSRSFRKQVTEPVAVSVSTILRQRHVSGMGHLFVSVPEDYRDNPDAHVSIDLPLGWVGDSGDRKRVSDAVSERLQVSDLSASWKLTGAHPSVSFHVPARPPQKVSFERALPDAVSAREEQPLLGYGAHERPERFDLKLEAPHLLIAGASNSGKSELIAFIVAHFMRHGYGVMVADAKYVSHMWLRRVPGVLYASEDEELHNALIWLDAELKTRARFVAAGGDSDTLVPLLAVLEEMNGASNRLRTYWRTVKQSSDPMMSPALTALQNLASMGRELRVHIVMAGQSLTAKATGGPETRENFGGRMFGQASAAQWRMLAPQIKKAPQKRGVPGRWHIVVGETVRELQVPFSDLKNESARLIGYATGGKEVPDVSAMLALWLAGQGGEGGWEEGADQQEYNASDPPPPPGISLRRFAEDVRPDISEKQWKRWRARPDWPSWVGIGGRNTHLFDPSHLRDFVRERMREEVSARHPGSEPE